MTKQPQEATKYEVILTRTAERALYDDEQVFMGTFDSLDSAAQALGSQFQFCKVVSVRGEAH